MPDPYGTEELFPVPPKYRPPKREQQWPVWRKYTGKRLSCDGCVLEIASGNRVALSEPASYSRADAKGTRYYCHRHTQDLKVRDGIRE